jgi:hypothetical protein
MAPLAGAYLAYCDLVRVADDKSVQKKTIAAAFTNGDADNLIVGRNGVFVHRDGTDWEATITKVVDNPISIRQAFWAPYKKFARMIEAQIAKRASAADADAMAKLENAAEATANVDKSKPDAPPPSKLDIGTIAAIGVAVGGISTFLGALFGKLVDTGPWLPAAIIALLLMISGPSMLLAYLKLRTRNLGPLLDANGWAINGRARINVPFGTALTEVAALPPGTALSLKDRYAEETRPWRLYIALAILVVLGGAWYLGKLDLYLPDVISSEHVLGDSAPIVKARKRAAVAPPAAAAAPAPAPAAPAPAAAPAK